MMRYINKNTNKQKGAALIEFVIVFPVLLMAFLGSLLVLLTMTARTAMERHIDDTLHVMSMDPMLWGAMPATGCNLESSSNVCNTSEGNDICGRINKYRDDILCQAGRVLFTTSGPGHGLAFLPGVFERNVLDPVTGFVGSNLVTVANPEIIMPSPLAGQSLEDAYSEQPIRINAQFLVDLPLPWGLPDIEVTVNAARFFEVPSDSSNPIPRDCNGIIQGMPGYGLGGCDCSARPNQVFDADLADCVSCPVGSLNLESLREQGVEDPTALGYVPDSNGCYYASNFCDPLGPAEIDFGFNNGNAKCKCLGQSTLNEEEDQCICEEYRLNNIVFPSTYDEASNTCICDFEQVTDELCREQVGSEDAIVDRTNSGFGCNCTCSNTCPEGFQLDSRAGHKDQGCECVPCPPGKCGRDPVEDTCELECRAPAIPNRACRDCVCPDIDCGIFSESRPEAADNCSCESTCAPCTGLGPDGKCSIITCDTEGVS